MGDLPNLLQELWGQAHAHLRIATTQAYLRRQRQRQLTRSSTADGIFPFTNAVHL